MFILCSHEPIRKHVISVWDLMLSSSGSIRRLKIRVERSQLCLVLFVIFWAAWQNNKLELMDENNDGWKIWPWIPHFWTIIKRYIKWTLWNAFSAFKGRSREGIIWCSVWWIMLTLQWVASEFCLPFVNPNWSECIKVRSRSISLFATTLAFSSRSRVSKEMGWTIWREVGSLPGLDKVIINTSFNNSFRK